jgi:hypothetical protein
LLGAAWGLIAACTLTSDDYHPALVVDGLLEPGGAGGAGDAGACEVGVACCDVAPCPLGQACVAGVCLLPTMADAGCVGTDCPGSEPVPLAPSCGDEQQNGDETGVDCGGSCPDRCALGDRCEVDADCAEGLSCRLEICVEPSCEDDVVNGDETAVDCGGTCPGCPDGAACSVGADCQSRVCGDDDTCSAPVCNDEQQNGNETGVDCGGDCPQDCPTGAGCDRNTDCQSGVCRTQACGAGLTSCCQAPSCNDGVRNGGESDVDCGTQQCGDCALGERCQLGGQCQTNQCTDGVCTNNPTCDDNQQNGNETGVDCGGGCAPCPDLSACNQPADCVNNNCDARGICISCGDAVQDGTESGVDCGGTDPACRRCNGGERCTSNTDCVNQFCLGGFC